MPLNSRIRSRQAGIDRILGFAGHGSRSVESGDTFRREEKGTRSVGHGCDSSKGTCRHFDVYPAIRTQHHQSLRCFVEAAMPPHVQHAQVTEVEAAKVETPVAETKEARGASRMFAAAYGECVFFSGEALHVQAPSEEGGGIS